jgi:hypothetical protein
MARIELAVNDPHEEIDGWVDQVLSERKRLVIAA